MPRNKQALIAALLTVGATGLVVGLKQAAIPPAYAACDPGDRIDSSTANDARRKVMAAGYTNAHDLIKGCDNVWHGLATTNGRESHVAVESTGKVYPEGN